jgi:hypothetical protein
MDEQVTREGGLPDQSPTPPIPHLHQWQEDLKALCLQGSGDQFLKANMGVDGIPTMPVEREEFHANPSLRRWAKVIG